MGEANRRGSFEQRKELAVSAKARRLEGLRQLKAEQARIAREKREAADKLREEQGLPALVENPRKSRLRVALAALSMLGMGFRK